VLRKRGTWEEDEVTPRVEQATVSIMGEQMHLSRSREWNGSHVVVRI
jgi:hypothetical protein